MQIEHAPRSKYAADGSIGSKQVADVSLPRAELDRVWSPEYLERLAATYWRFLTRFSLGLLRVLYTDDAREVVVIRRPFVLLRFRKPEYEIEPDGGTVTWPIEKGLLVAPAGRGQGLPAHHGAPRRPTTAARRDRPRPITSEVVELLSR